MHPWQIHAMRWVFLADAVTDWTTFCRTSREGFANSLHIHGTHAKRGSSQHYCFLHVPPTHC